MVAIQKHIPEKTVSQCRNFWMNNHIKLKLKQLAPAGTIPGLNAGCNRPIGDGDTDQGL